MALEDGDKALLLAVVLDFARANYLSGAETLPNIKGIYSNLKNLVEEEGIDPELLVDNLRFLLKAAAGGS